MQFLRITNLKSANDSFWNLFFHSDPLFNNLRFCLPILSLLLLTRLQSEAIVWWCSVKKVFQQFFANFKRKHLLEGRVFNEVADLQFNFSKKRFRHRCFFVNSGNFHKTFFKEPFGRLLLQKHSFGLLSQHDLLPFQKRCHTYFPAEYFLALICRLGTRVSSVF